MAIELNFKWEKADIQAGMVVINACCFNLSDNKILDLAWMIGYHTYSFSRESEPEIVLGGTASPNWDYSLFNLSDGLTYRADKRADFLDFLNDKSTCFRPATVDEIGRILISKKTLNDFMR